MTCRAAIFASIFLALWCSNARADESLGGQILTPDGKPADRAFVSVLINDGGDSYHIAASVKTNSAGEFSLTAPATSPPGNVLLIADLPGVGISRPIVIGSGKTSRISLLPSTELDATFLDPHGKPVTAGAVWPRAISWSADVSGLVPKINLPPEIAKRWQTQAGPDGVAIFHGLPGGANVDLVLADNHYALLNTSDGRTLQSSGVTHETIRLNPAAGLWISVVYADSHQPAAGIHLAISPGEFVGNLVSDEAGQIVLKRLRPGTFYITLNAQDRPADVSAPPVTILVRAGVRNETMVTLFPGGIIAGSVRNLTTGEGFANLRVATTGGQQAVTDALGNYVLHVPYGLQQVYMQSDPPVGFMRIPQSVVPLRRVVTVKKGSPATVDFSLMPGDNSAIEVQVVDPQGKPAAGALVQCIPDLLVGHDGVMQTEYADVDGRLRLHVPPRTVLRARLGDLATDSVIATGEAPDTITLKLSANATFTLTVKVVDAAGSIIHDSSVRLIGSPFAEPGMTQQTIADGVAVFDGLVCDAPWRIVAYASDYGQVQMTVPAPSGKPPRHVEMSVALPKADQPVSGIVVDQDDNPATGVNVILIGPQISQHIIKTDAQGHFEFHIPNGVRGIVQLQLPPPYQAYTQITGARTDLKFYLPRDLTAAAAAAPTNDHTAQTMQVFINRGIVLPIPPIPATQPTAEILRAKLDLKRAQELLQAQQ
jgi:hypothetical protein